MNGNEAATTAAEVEELAELVSGMEQKLAAWAHATGEWLESSGKITGTGIDKLVRPIVHELIHTPGSSIAGAGFVAAAGLLGEDRSYIAWWQGGDMERVDALANFSPQSMSRYVRAEWFKVPMATGSPHVTGPYIDLLCTDEYVLTFTHPVSMNGRLAGVVGMDVTAQTFERTALSLLRHIGPTAVLLNSDGRSIVSACAEVDAGDMVAPAADAQEFAIGRAFRIVSATAGH